MRRMQVGSSWVAIALPAIALMAGCAALPTGGGDRAAVSAVTPKASLALRFAVPRQVQAQLFEVTGATVSIMLPDVPPIAVPLATDSLAEFACAVEDLPAGDAAVRLDVYRNAELIGSGSTMVPLMHGRRSSAFIQLMMDSRGFTDFTPLTPNLLTRVGV
ncbi:hypothetical protein D3C86_1103450 [compost metagenome]